MAAKKETTKEAPKTELAIKSVGIVKKGGLYYVVTVTTQGDKVIETEWNNDGDILPIAQDTLRTTAGRLFWQQIHKDA